MKDGKRDSSTTTAWKVTDKQEGPDLDVGLPSGLFHDFGKPMQFVIPCMLSLQSASDTYQNSKPLPIEILYAY